MTRLRRVSSRGALVLRGTQNTPPRQKSDAARWTVGAAAASGATYAHGIVPRRDDGSAPSMATFARERRAPCPVSAAGKCASAGRRRRGCRRTRRAQRWACDHSGQDAIVWTLATRDTASLIHVQTRRAAAAGNLGLLHAAGPDWPESEWALWLPPWCDIPGPLLERHPGARRQSLSDSGLSRLPLRCHGLQCRLSRMQPSVRPVAALPRVGREDHAGSERTAAASASRTGCARRCRAEAKAEHCRKKQAEQVNSFGAANQYSQQERGLLTPA